MSTNLEDFEHQLETHLDPTLNLDPAQADFLAFIDSIVNPDTKPTNLMNTINYVASDVAGNLNTAASSSQRSASQPSPSSSSSSFVLPSLLPSSSNSIAGLDESSSLANIVPDQPPSSSNNNNTQTSVVVINDRLGKPLFSFRSSSKYTYIVLIVPSLKLTPLGAVKSCPLGKS